MTVQELYDVYNNKLKPLLVFVEAQLERFPIGVLNEVRAFNDHIARTYDSSFEEEKKAKEYEIAYRHILRGILDCCKVLCVHEEETVEKFFKNYAGVRLGDVDSGRFLPAFTEKLGRARRLVKDAKLSESRPSEDRKDEAVALFESAVLAYGDLRDFVDSMGHHLTWSVTHQRKMAVKQHAFGALIGFLIGCLSTWVMSKIL